MDHEGWRHTGGGAGGLVVLDATAQLGCLTIDASGGSGGGADNGDSPGGGGVPGRVARGGPRDACTTVKTNPGRAGKQLGGTTRNAAGGEAGDGAFVIAR